MAFCGSTQLAQLLNASGAATVLKEPQALVDLADWKRALVEQQLDGDRQFKLALGASAALLWRNWDGFPPTVVKPSNWANNLLPDLLSINGAKAVVLTIEPRLFLRAIFRGGRDRMAFIARAASHLASATRQGAIVREAIVSTEDPLGRVARLALVAHGIQHAMFDAAAASAVEVVDYRQILADPAEALRRTIESLG